MKTLCTILARAGSKRCPDKNFKSFAGTSLMDITIEQAKRIFDDIVFSSDSLFMVKKADDHKIPAQLRPRNFAGDDTPAIDAIKYTVEEHEKHTGITYDAIVNLQVTSPLRSDEDIEECVGVIGGGIYNVLTVCDRPHLFDHSSYEYETKQQANGAVYVWTRDHLQTWDEWGRFYHYLMPPERSIDIDTQQDFEIGEFLYEKYMRG